MYYKHMKKNHTFIFNVFNKHNLHSVLFFFNTWKPKYGFSHIQSVNKLNGKLYHQFRILKDIVTHF